MKYLLSILLGGIAAVVAAQPLVLSQREQARVVDELLDERLRIVLPGLMREEKIDLWVIISREYNEDPVIRTLLPATWFAARRTTMLIAFDPGPEKELELLAVSRYDVGQRFKRAWDPDAQPDQWSQLARLIADRKPRRIGINKSPHYGHADGLTSNDFDLLMQVLPKNMQSRVVSAQTLAVRWLETRTDREVVLYQHICRVAHDIIAEGFSDRVIQAGVTTTEDVVWWFRERIRERKLDTWFQPTVSIQRNEPDVVTAKRPLPLVIQPGDLLHVDFGITYLRLNTDTQQHAYMLRPGETEAPLFLQEALKKGNRLQDILVSYFREGITGNEILARTRTQALAEGITPSIYTHPIGFHGHAAGTTIGMWDMQEGVPFTGDFPLHARTAYSIELNCSVPVPEWKKDIRIQLEEDGYFDGKEFRYLDGRQVQLILIPQPGITNR